jgi:hypothetical protein
LKRRKDQQHLVGDCTKPVGAFSLVMILLCSMFTLPIASGYLLDVVGQSVRTINVALLVGIALIALLFILRTAFRGPLAFEPARLVGGVIAFASALLIGLFIGWPSFLPKSPSVDAVHHHALIDYIIRHQHLVHDLTEADNLGEMVAYPFGATLLVAILSGATKIPSIMLMHPMASLILAFSCLFLYAILTELLDKKLLYYLLSLLVVPLYFWPVSYTIGQFTRDFYLTQMLGVACLTGLIYWFILYVRTNQRVWLLPIFGLGATLIFSYPTLIPAFVFVVVIALRIKGSQLNWRLWLPGLTTCGAGLMVVGIFYLKDRVGAGMNIIRHDGATISPSLDTLPLGFLILSLLGLLYSTIHPKFQLFSALAWGTLLQTIAFYSVVLIWDELSPYAAKKMIFVLVPQMAVLVGLVIAVTIDRIWHLKMPPGLRLFRQLVYAPALIVLVLVGNTWSEAFDQYDPRTWTRSLLTSDLLVVADWAKSNLDSQRMAYFASERTTAYWLDIGLLKHSRNEFASLPINKPSPSEFWRWFRGESSEEYAFVVSGIDYLTGPEVTPLFRSGDAAIVKRASPSTEGRGASGVAHRRLAAYWVGNEIKLTQVHLDIQRHFPGDRLPVSIDIELTESLRTHYFAQARLVDWQRTTVSQREVQVVPIDRFPVSRGGRSVTLDISLPIPAATTSGVYTIELAFFDANWEAVNLPIGGIFADIPILAGTALIASHSDLLDSSFTPSLSIVHRLGKNIELLGTDPIIFEGNLISVDVYWRLASEGSQNYTIFVQLLDSAGKIASQLDVPPWSGGYPTSAWSLGHVIRDRYRLDISQTNLSGDYSLIAGMYSTDSLERLPMTSKTGEPVGDYAVLATMNYPKASP